MPTILRILPQCPRQNEATEAFLSRSSAGIKALSPLSCLVLGLRFLAVLMFLVLQHAEGKQHVPIEGGRKPEHGYAQYGHLC